MTALYVTAPGTTLRRTGDSLVLTSHRDHGGQPTAFEIEPDQVHAIAFVGDGHATAEAMHHCFERGISLTWLSRNGHLRARCLPHVPRSGSLRLAQYAAASDTSRTLHFARAMVTAKIENSIALLVDSQGNHPGDASLATAIGTSKELRARLPVTDDVEVVRGLEGAAAAAFFGGFGAALRTGTGMEFTRRTRRPPTDPVNAMLSFASSLVTNLLTGLLEARGLDPTIGFLHAPRSGRPSLALDLLEEWRAPLVCRFVLRTCNLRILRPEHFEADAQNPGGVRMTRDGLRQYFLAWERFLLRAVRTQDGADRNVIPSLAHQIDGLAASLVNGGDHCPVVVR